MCLDLICCCLGPAACGLCFAGAKVKKSVSTRLLYSSLVFVVVAVCSIMLSPSLASTLQNAKLLCVPLNGNFPNVPSFVPRINVSNLLQCDQFVGYLAAYRVCMAVACFFLILAVIMVCVNSSGDPRAYLQNGFWLFKFLFVIGLVVTFFFIPDGQNFIFSKTSMVIGMMASIVFIVVQIVFLVDFSCCWAENWIAKAEDNDNKWWYILMLVFSIIFYIGSLIGITLLFFFFTEAQSCHLNKFFISSTLVLGIIVSVMSILPCIQRAHPKSGLLQASVVMAYCTYVTWSAISTEPYGTERGTGKLYNCQTHNSSLAIFGHGSGTSSAASVVGIALLFITVVYMCFNLSTNKQIQKFLGRSEDDSDDEEGRMERVYIHAMLNQNGHAYKEEKEGKWHLYSTDDEHVAVGYSYTLFHLLMMLAILYFMMQLTNWANPGAADTEHFQSTWASTWVKMASSWLCYTVYLWTLLAPLLLGKCRSFDD